MDLEEVVRSTPWLLAALRVARDVDPPEWLLGAGAVRGAVWDRVHGRDPEPPKDVDVVFFDADDLSPERDAQVERELGDRAPGIPWDAKNQAAVHLWYPQRFGRAVEPLTSSADGVATWPETATCVALRLDARDRLTVVAPYGLDDLLGLVNRRNPRRVSVDEYERRVRDKDIARRWPRATIVPGQRR
jgi:uncharacterized protein